MSWYGWVAGEEVKVPSWNWESACLLVLVTVAVFVLATMDALVRLVLRGLDWLERRR